MITYSNLQSNLYTTYKIFKYKYIGYLHSYCHNEQQNKDNLITYQKKLRYQLLHYDYIYYTIAYATYDEQKNKRYILVKILKKQQNKKGINNYIGVSTHFFFKEVLLLIFFSVSALFKIQLCIFL